MRKWQEAQGASTGNLFAILFQSSGQRAGVLFPALVGSGVAKPALLSGRQRGCAMPEGSKQVLYLDSSLLTGVSSHAKKQRIRNKFRNLWTLFFNRWYNRQSPIANRQSPIANRQSPIANRQSPPRRIAPFVFCWPDFLKPAVSRFSSSAQFFRKQLALKTLAGFCLLAAASAPALAQVVPTISCTTDPIIFNTGIDGSGSGRLPHDAPDANWKYYSEPGTARHNQNPEPLTLNWSPVRVYNTPINQSPPTAANAQWAGDGSSGIYGTFWFLYEFELDSSVVDPSIFNLSINLNVDLDSVHIFVNGEDNTSISGANLVTEGRWDSSPAYVILNKGWKSGKNRIIFVARNVTGGAGLLIQPTGAPLCAGKFSVTKTASQSSPDAVRYAITLSNEGSVPVTGVTVNDPLPTGLSGSNWTCAAPAGSTASCPVSSGTTLAQSGITLPAHASLVYTVNATVDAASAASTRTNTAQADAVNGAFCWDGTAASVPPCKASSSIFAGTGYLRIDKTVKGTGPFASGSTVSYDIVLSNAGSTALSGVSVDDALPTELINGAWTCQPAALCPNVSGASMPLVEGGITLPAHASVTYTVTATVDAVTASSTLSNLEAQASAAAGTACWSGTTTSALPCKASASLLLVPLAASAVPTLDRWAYGLVGLGVLAMAGVAARRRRVAR
ncbi:MAG: DUF11 domain-containing protein [Burkholderiaceae bacterium]|jgi:uncharacterized repeat protein (TIGR01451 family)|nr:DUF11 domain-containing protein [Burkholderiaceae bacterium]